MDWDGVAVEENVDCLITKISLRNEKDAVVRAAAAPTVFDHIIGMAVLIAGGAEEKHHMVVGGEVVVPGPLAFECRNAAMGSDRNGDEALLGMA